ncbi:MAG: DegT/DnrJ/EryC1/StrS family aminotransferase [Candidatus Obscuribacterales bacterium]
MSKLALLGGKPAITKKFPPYRSIGKEEAAAVAAVMESGNLSEFLGVWGEFFDGGPRIREFEQAWASKFNAKHAISVNSATSGLFAAMGAVGISPGDEVIVPPYTMSATVMAPLVYGGIPVFADIDPDYFCMNVAHIEKLITPKTRAILTVNLFGHPSELARLRKIADERNIYLIEDNSQGPLASENGKFAGTIGHIGIFSLNYHKHIHTGEGGVCVTEDDELALRLRLIRNHGENAVEPAEIMDLTNLIGFNYRLTEMGAAIGTEQLKKVDALVDEREAVAVKLSKALSGIAGFTPPAIRENCRHVFYVWSAKYNAKEFDDVPREVIKEALAAEGLGSFGSYVKPLYLLPMFQRRVAMGREGFPFNLTNVTYNKGICPVTERMFEKELLVFPLCSYDLSVKDIDEVAAAFRKVFDNKDELRKHVRNSSTATAVSS